MRRTIPAAIALSCVVGAPALAAPQGHTEKVGYTAPGSAEGRNATVNVVGHHYGFAQVSSRKSDRSVRLNLTDASGLPVSFDVAQWSGDRNYDLGSYCSTTPKLRLPKPGNYVVVYLNAGACGDEQSVPTTGTITASFR